MHAHMHMHMHAHARVYLAMDAANSVNVASAVDAVAGRPLHSHCDTTYTMYGQLQVTQVNTPLQTQAAIELIESVERTY